MYCWDELPAPASVGAITHISSCFRRSRVLPKPAPSLSMQIWAVHACEGRHAVPGARGRETRTPPTPTTPSLPTAGCAFSCEETWRCGSYLQRVSVEMTWELALAVCVSTPSHAEWLLCMCVLTHVGAASCETTQVI